MAPSPTIQFRSLVPVLVFSLVLLVTSGSCAGTGERVLNPAPITPRAANGHSGGDAPARPVHAEESSREPVVIDRATVIINEATNRFRLGEAAYKAGDLEGARAHFDAAVLRFLDSGEQIAGNPRLQAARIK